MFYFFGSRIIIRRKNGRVEEPSLIRRQHAGRRKSIDPLVGRAHIDRLFASR